MKKELKRTCFILTILKEYSKMDRQKLKILRQRSNYRKANKQVDRSELFKDDYIMFVLTGDEANFICKTLHWVLKKYPESKHKSLINDILNYVEKIRED